MLILASQSPRRREILERAGIAFSVQATGIPEKIQQGETAFDYVTRLSRAKAAAAKGNLVLGADTVVVVDERILEKPMDLKDATRMLQLLSGREHSVLTGVCLRKGELLLSNACKTLVRFVKLSDQEIETYVASGEPMDKAGAYAIQGLASKFIDKIEGDYFNVVGLPISLVYSMLKQAGEVRF